MVGLGKLASAAVPILRECRRISDRIVRVQAAKSAKERVVIEPLHQLPFAPNAAGTCSESTWSSTPMGSMASRASIQRLSRGDSSAMTGATH